MPCSSFFWKHCQLISIFCLLLVCITGCGEQATRAKVVPVTGRVFLDGQPLTFGTVTFRPSRGQPATGEVQSDGKFTLSTYEEGDGAAVGEHQIRVTAYQIQDPEAEPVDNEGDSLGPLVTPEKYSRFPTSTLKALVVESGNAPFILRLETPPPEEETTEGVLEVDKEDAEEDSQEEASTTNPSGESAPEQEEADTTPES